MVGVAGHLFPVQFLAERVSTDTAGEAAWLQWWAGVSRACGPATGARGVFDQVAMPLAARLGFRARDLTRRPDGLAARLLTPRGQPVALLVYGWRGWTARPPAPWRDAVGLAREHHARWAMVLAPPHLSLVPALGQSTRRALDFVFPDALHGAGLSLLTTLAHAGAFDRHEHEQWLADAATFHARVHAGLQQGVVDALGTLTQVLRGPAPAGRHAFDEALTLVYRLLFLLYAESRAMVPLHHPHFRASYSLTALGADIAGGRVEGLWEALAAITRVSRSGGRIDALHLTPFNGPLFSRRAAPSLEPHRAPSGPTRASRARDAAVASAITALATRPDASGRIPVQYGDLGVEQLGAVYERVLDLDASAIGQEPIAPPPRRHSPARKASGTFYTPTAIADLTVRLTLAPLVAGRRADQILELRIVDPAMGSGAFLVSALQYLSTAYERAIVDDGVLAPLEIDDAMRRRIRRSIAQRCLYGVDVNPVAVGVARLSVWLATLAQDKPLSFLDHRLRVGNSLVGGTLEALRRPVGAVAHDLPLFDDPDPQITATLRHRSACLGALGDEPDDSVEAVRSKERRWQRLIATDGESAHVSRAMDVWCARWFWPDRRPPAARECRALIEGLLRERDELPPAIQAPLLARIDRVARRHHFFHWQTEFADVFFDADGRPRAKAGFDAVIGNPPWEVVRRDPVAAFLKGSGRFAATGRGHINLYLPFAEQALELLHPAGRAGLVVPWSLAVDDGAAGLRARLTDHGVLDTVVGYDNVRALFPIHRGVRFATVVVRASSGITTSPTQARITTGVATVAEIEQVIDAADRGRPGNRELRVCHRRLRAMGGPPARWPALRGPTCLTFLDRLRRFPAAGAADGWQLSFGRELNATDDRPWMRTRVRGAAPDPQWLPVLEGKHIRAHRVDLSTVSHEAPRAVLDRRFPDGRFCRPRLAYRDVSAVGNTRALIAAIVPADVVTTHSLFCLRTPLPLPQMQFLCGLFNSDVLDRWARYFMGSHVTAGLIAQMPLPRWTGDARQRLVARLAAALGRHPDRRLQARLNHLAMKMFEINQIPDY